MEDKFKNAKQAWEWLQENGYKVSNGKFYGDCSKGIITVYPDKSVSKFQVLQYGINWNNKVSNPGNIDQIASAEVDMRKRSAEASIAERKDRRMEKEEDQLWLHADEGWAVVASVINQLRDSIRHYLYSSRREVVATSAGNQDRDDEVYSLLEHLVDQAFNETAGKSINIKFNKND